MSLMLLKSVGRVKGPLQLEVGFAFADEDHDARQSTYEIVIALNVCERKARRGFEWRR